MTRFWPKTFSILCLFFILFSQVNAQTTDIDPFLTESRDENGVSIKNFGRTLSLFLNPFDSHSGNLPVTSRLGLSVRRAVVNIPGSDRNGILGSKSRHFYDMFGITSALSPRLNMAVFLHSPNGTINNKKAVAWSGHLRYNLVGLETNNHIYLSGSFSEIKHVEDYYFKQVCIEAVYNNRNYFLHYSFGVGVNRYHLKLFPDGTSENFYPGSIIKNVFKYGAGAQYTYHKHWQLAMTYTKSIYSVYQFEIQYQF